MCLLEWLTELAFLAHIRPQVFFKVDISEETLCCKLHGL